LLEVANNCSFCDAPLAEAGENLEPVAVGAGITSRASSSRASSVSVSLEEQPVEPEWRREVSRRLEDYRARRGHLRSDDLQSGLPFSRQSKINEELAAQERQREAERQRQAERQRVRIAQRKTEHVEICVQPELDFSSAAHERAHPQTALVPVASLVERRKAGLLDAIFLGLTYAGFLGLFRSLGGQLVVEKADTAVYLAVFFLFYGLYFSLFTTCAEATPGMQLLCLTAVRLDGTVPDTRQLLWRSFGYLLAGVTFMLGFVWALWDEDHFTWQDRISQTYITGAMPLMEQDAFELPIERRSFARK
jgi:uncharacterized RDD family membrane protein YckC